MREAEVVDQDFLHLQTGTSDGLLLVGDKHSHVISQLFNKRLEVLFHDGWDVHEDRDVALLLRWLSCCQLLIDFVELLLEEFQTMGANVLA